MEHGNDTVTDSRQAAIGMISQEVSGWGEINYLFREDYDKENLTIDFGNK